VEKGDEFTGDRPCRRVSSAAADKCPTSAARSIHVGHTWRGRPEKPQRRPRGAATPQGRGGPGCLGLAASRRAAMIKAVVVMNNHGQPRLTKFYEHTPEDRQQQFIRDAFSLLSRRADGLCNFVDGGTVFGPDVRVIYRHYATLFFVFCVDQAESELGILDLIQVFVETLDRCFENVCELDLIFHMDKINFVLDELIVGGLVLETNMADILEALQAAKRHSQVR
jgi:AP-3 complex subunit sigma